MSEWYEEGSPAEQFKKVMLTDELCEKLKQHAKRNDIISLMHLVRAVEKVCRTDKELEKADAVHFITDLLTEYCGGPDKLLKPVTSDDRAELERLEKVWEAEDARQ
jgi:hypothetical protein